MFKLYNTLSKSKETFEPINKKGVLFYHCGPTVYWTQHIGNMRAVFCGDILVRTLKYLGYKVEHVRNYTDVGHLTDDADQGEDKMEKGTKREGISPQEIAQKYIKIYERDVELLNTLPPTYKPKATECIDEIIQMIKTLLDNNYAYSTDLAIYFDISKVKDYTKLSGQNLEKLIKGAGKGTTTDPQKKNPLDFSLWFFKAGQHKNALQYWPSPFNSSLVEKGNGFPGWHIECSVMAKKYLGDTIDIHMGGVDHISIHHTNEIAQSESANQVKYVNYWLHNEHLTVNGAKMAKSEGTGYSIEEIVEKGFDPIALRYLFLQAHYRSKQDFTWDTMKAAQNGLDNLYFEFKKLGKKTGKIDEDYRKEFTEKISDDLGTPQALAIAQKILKSDLSPENKRATLLDFDKILGLKLDQLENTVSREISNLLKEREEARKKEDWKRADTIRDEIESKGYIIEDTKEGARASKK